MAASTLLSLLNPAVNTCDGLDAICCSCSLLNFLPIPREKTSTPFCFKLLAGTSTLSCEIPSVMITRTGFLPLVLPRPNKYLERKGHTYRGKNCSRIFTLRNLFFLASLLKVLSKQLSMKISPQSLIAVTPVIIKACTNRWAQFFKRG